MSSEARAPQPEGIGPPQAPRRPHRMEAHGDVRVDDWYWLRDKDGPEVVAHLQAENAYTEAVATARFGDLPARLFEEFRARIQETDSSVPARKGSWWWYWRSVEGLQYAIHCRRPDAGGAPGDPEQVVLDENALAAGHDYLAVGSMALTTDQRLLAYAVDTSGDEVHDVRIRDLDTGADRADLVPATGEGLAFSTDGRHLFYTRLDDAMRPYQLWRHDVGTPAASDTLVLQEDDDAFHLSLEMTSDEAWVVVTLESMITTEVHVIPAAEPCLAPRLIERRREGIQYRLDHHDGWFLIVTDEDAPDGRLLRTPVDQPDRDAWTEVIGARPDVKLEGIDSFAHHLVLYERAAGIPRLAVRRTDDGTTHVVEQPEPACSVSPENNPEFNTDRFRFIYTSLTTPATVVEYGMDGGPRVELKRQPVLGDFDPDRYRSERLWATAGDGERVPISLVHHVDVAADGTAPCVLYGYGAYESSLDPWFSAARLSLLDRGVNFAIAHVRGGGELGRRWWDAGKLAAKPNSFADFVACGEHLVDEGWSRTDGLVARGASAGGLLVAAAANLRPDLFRAVVAEVPFVDCLTTMLDPDLPLTAQEWDEWGDPIDDPGAYAAIKAWSPYDNVRAQPYPRMLVTAGLHDPRVGVWEPAKWVQRLRATTTSGEPVLLKTELGAGHQGPSGRYDIWKEEAFVYAFMLDAVGKAR